MDRVKPFLGFVFRVTVLHFITYWLFGLVFGVLLFNYPYRFSVPPYSLYMKSTTSIWVIAGPLFQLIRGPIMALVLYPFRSVFLDRKYGWMYLWGLFFGLAILNSPGPAPGSIEGMVYTIIPVWLQIALLPETVLQTLAFSFLFYLWQKHSESKKLSTLFLVLFILILALSVLGVLLKAMTLSVQDQ